MRESRERENKKGKGNQDRLKGGFRGVPELLVHEVAFEEIRLNRWNSNKGLRRVLGIHSHSSNQHICTVKVDSNDLASVSEFPPSSSL